MYISNTLKQTKLIKHMTINKNIQYSNIHPAQELDLYLPGYTDNPTLHPLVYSHSRRRFHGRRQGQF